MGGSRKANRGRFRPATAWRAGLRQNPRGNRFQVPLETKGRFQLMGILDKITGRAKKAAGDVADDPSLRREGRQEERKGEAKEELGSAQERADAKADEVANLERKT